MDNKTLLIVWVYFPAVGHLVEALEVAANYHKSNPDFKIYLLVHYKTPYKIGSYCDFIEAVYPVDDKNYQNDQGVIINVPNNTFDYVVFPKRLFYTPQDFTESLLTCNLTLKAYFKARIWSGYNDTADNHPQVLKASHYSGFKIIVPKENLSLNVTKPEGNPIIAVMLKGASKDTIWPSFRTWHKLLLTIKANYPEAQFYITGITAAHVTNKLTTLKVQQKIKKFTASIPGAVNYYDIGLDNQLGLIQRADVFLSPHTGFAFLAPCLGTPWLAFSGGQWAEHMPAQMPFYSVLPQCNRYPCNNGSMKTACKIKLKVKQPILCMNLTRYRLDEIVLGLNKLLNHNYSFQEAFKDYEQSALNKGVHLKKLWRLTNYYNNLH